jgi:hypothetical protein
VSDATWKLEDDLRTARLTFSEVPAIAVKFDVDRIEEALRHLGAFRSSMQPSIPDDWSAAATSTSAIDEPQMVVEMDPAIGSPVLRVRDPRFGWLHYVLTPQQARRLGSALVLQAYPPSSAQRQ